MGKYHALRDILSDDSRVALEAIKFMSPNPEAVDEMTRSELHTHLSVRERIVRRDHPNDWQSRLDAEVFDKLERWAAMRDVHEILKAVRRTH